MYLIFRNWRIGQCVSLSRICDREFHKNNNFHWGQIENAEILLFPFKTMYSAVQLIGSSLVLLLLWIMMKPSKMEILNLCYSDGVLRPWNSGGLLFDFILRSKAIRGTQYLDIISDIPSWLATSHVPFDTTSSNGQNPLQSQ